MTAPALDPINDTEHRQAIAALLDAPAATQRNVDLLVQLADLRATARQQRDIIDEQAAELARLRKARRGVTAADEAENMAQERPGRRF